MKIKKKKKETFSLVTTGGGGGGGFGFRQSGIKRRMRPNGNDKNPIATHISH